MAASKPVFAMRGGEKVRVRLGTPYLHADATVAVRVRTAIKRGELQSGDRLPSENEIAQALALSRDPVRRGLQILAADGVLESRQGSGWFVL